jgi:hypothetical protein
MGEGTSRRAGGRPKKTKAAGINPTSGKVTTVMVRNLPTTLKQHDFVRELDVTGFEGTYDICYLPVNFSTGQSRGYAFVNFKQAAEASRFRAAWHHVERFGCRDPLVDVSPARVQGYEANAAKANSPHVCKVRNPTFRALILDKDQAAESPAPSPFGSPCSAELGAPPCGPRGPASRLSMRACSTPLGHAARPPPANSQGPLRLEAGDRIAGLAGPAPQHPLATSPAVVPRAAPHVASVTIFMLVGGPQHGALQDSPTARATSTPSYCITAR